MGCKMMFLVFGVLAILGFFALLMNFTQGLATSANVRLRKIDFERDAPFLLGGMQGYATDHGGKFPPMETAEAMKAALYPQYVTKDDIFTRKGDNVPYRPNPALSGKLVSDYTKKADETVALFETSPVGTDSPTRGICYLSGRHDRVKEEGWEAVRGVYGLP